MKRVTSPKALLNFHARFNVCIQYKNSLFIALLMLLFFSHAGHALDTAEDDYALKLLGKYLFFDTALSDPATQSCSSCHTPGAGWTNGNSFINQTTVAVPGAPLVQVGAMKPPSNAYASFADNFSDAPLSGGNFWDGRATGDEVAGMNVLGGDLERYDVYLGPTADQAHASPFINPVEQAVSTKIEVCETVRSARYEPLYEYAYDGQLMDCDADVDTTFARFAVALAAYQHSSEVNAFDSKRDRALANDDDDTPHAFPLKDFSDQENLGHDLFYGEESLLNPTAKNANCALFCHRSDFRTNGTLPQELYTGNGYFNIGTPRNIQIPGNPEPSVGVIVNTGNSNHSGLQKVPTLRNVDKRSYNGFVKAYMHNGYFKSLETVVHFYNTRDAKPQCAVDTPEASALAQGCWPASGIDVNVIGGGIIGNLGLSADEKTALVAYLKTLSDIPTPKAPRPFRLRKFLRDTQQ